MKKDIHKIREWVNLNPIIAILFVSSFYILVFKKSNSFETWVLFLTFIAIVWYTLETAELRKETHNANKLAVMPIIFFSREVDLNKPTRKVKAYLLNIGKGNAFKVTLFLKILEENKEENVFKLHLEKISPGEKKRLTDFFISDDERNKAELIQRNLEIVDINTTFLLEVLYEDIFRNKFKMLFEVGQKGIEVINREVF